MTNSRLRSRLGENGRNYIVRTSDGTPCWAGSTARLESATAIAIRESIRRRETGSFGDYPLTPQA
jgi:hypothetical protein